MFLFSEKEYSNIYIHYPGVLDWDSKVNQHHLVKIIRRVLLLDLLTNKQISSTTFSCIFIVLWVLDKGTYEYFQYKKRHRLDTSS